MLCEVRMTLWPAAWILWMILQRFLLATSTKVDVSGVKVPDSINDKYFARYTLLLSGIYQADYDE